MFTHKRNLGNLRIPKLFNTELKLTHEVKYLGVILDSKLLWNKHLDHKLQRACTTFYQCSRMLGKTWGLTPKITTWLYTAVIRPTLTYGAIVWWKRTELNTAANRLQRFQRLACSAITGCMRTTPTTAMEIVLGLVPLDLYIQQEATLSAIRLKHLNLWGNTRSSHACILDRAISHEPLICAPCDKIPRQSTSQKHYKIQTHENQSDQSGNSEVRVYTDGSKTNQGTGAGVHSLDLNINISMTLGSHSSIFQCECVAITEAATAIKRRGIEDYSIRILSDSTATLRALESQKCNSRLIYECHLALESIAAKNRVTLQWIKGHSGSLGNDAADELARRGSETQVEGPAPFLPLPFSQLRTWIRQHTQNLHNDRWIRATDCRQSRAAIPAATPRLTRRLMNLQRQDLKIIIGTLTGHCPLNKHLYNIGITDSPLCRGCLTEEESAAHVVLECVGVAAQRQQTLNNPRSLLEACEDPRKLLCFWEELGWLHN